MTAIEKKQNKIIEKLNQIIGCFETLLNHPYDLDSIKRLENLKSELADLKSKQSQRKNIEKVMALDEDDGLYNSDEPQPEQSAEEIPKRLKNKAPIVRRYGSFIILAQNESDYKIKLRKLMKGDTKGFYYIPQQSEQSAEEISYVCNNWMPDKTTSATRCVNCGKDRWQHQL